ncbi:MAG: hypothetical protein RPU52_05785 [Candidatus Sedimenticola sp. (ex Thyasira tokunagai)]
MRILFATILITISLTAAAEVPFEFSGKAGAELRLFTEDAQYSGQQGNSNLSGFIEPEFFWDLNEGNDTLIFKPFLRVDQNDSRRSHGDIRELMWNHLGDDWELRAGLGKVFWGVTEFQHLVDTINQTDGVEDVDGEAKLGQPMINLSLVRDWGIFDLFLLPGFRERTFVGTSGRLRTALVVDSDQAGYEATNEEQHLDIALRWSHAIGDYDIGLHWFHGTNRDPLLVSGTKGSTPVLIPYYEQMDQVGLDLQATIEAWLWKLETLWRNTNSAQYWAAQGGFEYTIVGINESSADLGLLMEYGWDERGTSASAVMQNDLFVGARLALNDEAGGELLAGLGYDLDYKSKSVLIEASRRLGDNWKTGMNARFYFIDDSSDPISSTADDSHLMFTLERYF